MNCVTVGAHVRVRVSVSANVNVSDSISMNIGICMSLNTVFNISFNGCRSTSISTTSINKFIYHIVIY